MIAIVIPTLNRSKYLQRALEFYSRMDFDGLIYIGDSSSNTERLKNEHLVYSYADTLSIHYHYIHGFHDGAVVTELNKQLHETVRYVVFSGDDDFLVPQGLKKCEEFLDEHPDYVACHGHRINFAYTGNKVRLLNVRYGYDWDETFTQEERLLEYLHVGISLTNYLHRKDVFVKRYKVANQIPARYLGGELVQECTTALSGKVKFLNDVVSFLFYQDNPERVFSFEAVSLFDIINKEGWAESYKIVLDHLTSLMETPDRELMNKYLYLHILSVMSAQYGQRYGNPTLTKTSKNECDMGALASEVGELLQLVGTIAYESTI